MKTNNITFEVTIDCICMKSISIWSKLQKRIDQFNVQNGRKTGLDNITFDLELACPVTYKKLRRSIAKKSIDIIGYAPYREIEGECAVYTVGPKDEENVIIEMNTMNWTKEAQEMSRFSDDLVYRGFVSLNSPDYEDYKNGERIGTGSFS